MAAARPAVWLQGADPVPLCTHAHMHTRLMHTHRHAHPQVSLQRWRVSAPSPLPREHDETLTPWPEPPPAWLAQIPCDEGVSLSCWRPWIQAHRTQHGGDTAPPWTCSMKGLGLHWA